MFKAEHQQDELFHQLQQLRVHQTGSVQPQTAAVQGHDMVNINIYSMIEILLNVENVYKVLIVRIWRSVVHNYRISEYHRSYRQPERSAGT